MSKREIVSVTFLKRGTSNGKDDISAEEDLSCKSAWLPCKNGNKGRKKGFIGKKKKRQKGSFSLTIKESTKTTAFVVFFLHRIHLWKV